MRDKYCKCHHPEHYHYFTVAGKRGYCVRETCDCEEFRPTKRAADWLWARANHWLEETLVVLRGWFTFP